MTQKKKSSCKHWFCCVVVAFNAYLKLPLKYISLNSKLSYFITVFYLLYKSLL